MGASAISRAGRYYIDSWRGNPLGGMDRQTLRDRVHRFSATVGASEQLCIEVILPAFEVCSRCATHRYICPIPDSLYGWQLPRTSPDKIECNQQGNDGTEIRGYEYAESTSLLDLAML